MKEAKKTDVQKSVRDLCGIIDLAKAGR